MLLRAYRILDVRPKAGASARVEGGATRTPPCRRELFGLFVSELLSPSV